MRQSTGGNMRQFLDKDVDLGDWAAVEPYYKELEGRVIPSVDALASWLRDLSELESWLSEEGVVREVEMTCQTDDIQREKRHLEFIENMSPRIRDWSDRMDRKLLACEHRSALAADRYGVLLRRVENRVSIFRSENIPLHTEDEKLRQAYQKITGSIAVSFNGREHTVQQMARYLEEPDRATREAAWRATTAQWSAASDEIEAIYEKMIDVRQRIASNAGMRDYREYAFRDMERFDYTAADCETFANSIESVAVPAARRLAEDRMRSLGVESLRPWDLSVDPEGLPPLRPFEGVDDLIAGCERVFRRVDADLADQFQVMRREGLLDLASRKGKAPGGYMAVFEGRRLPFIFMNAVGTQSDVRTLLHEGGHAFHAFATREEDLLPLRNAPIEFAEVASMSMEMLGQPHLDAFYRDDALGRARAEQLRGIIAFFPWMATIDMFQHWVYTHANHDRAQRRAAWVELNRRFAGWVDYSGVEDAMACSWHRKLHPFTVPFYYVEYGIAQLGALGVWLNALQDRAGATRAYRHALSLGGSRPLPALFEAAGVQFDFSEQAVSPRIRAVEDALRELR